ncbi:MAG: DUF4136 domain-containing protein [Chryseosolibacter sp.]
MNNLRPVVLMMLLFALGCSQKFQVYTVSDSDYDVRLFSGYTWFPMKDIEYGNNPLYYNEMNDKYIQAAVDRNLADRNFRRTDEPAELVLHYHIVERSMTVSREDPFFYHHAPWMGPEPVYEDYTEGTLIIDIMEKKSNALVWRGLAKGFFNTAQPYLSKKDIDAAIDRIFKDFPTAFF